VRALGARYFGYGVPDMDIDRFACRWTTTLTPPSGGEHRFGIMATGRARLTIDDQVVIDTFDGPAPPDLFAGGAPVEVQGTASLEAGRPHTLEVLYGRERVASPPWMQLGVEFDEASDAQLADAVARAQQADVAVVVVGTGPDGETEGYDRADLDLPGRQVELLTRVAEANPRTVVVVNAGAPVDLTWADRVPAIVWAGFGGQEMGHALADVLLGAADPGGRLPFTLPERLEDTPSHAHYPGPPGQLLYGEDLLMGYRGYDAAGTEPFRPFGFGHSYATFTWGDATVEPSTDGGAGRDDHVFVVEVPVTNTSDRAGVEVVQLYVHDVQSSVERPPQELRAFAKLPIEPGATATARLALDRRAFAVWDPTTVDWVVEPGAFEVRLGTSSRDIRQRVTISWPPVA
jgi:beta-glucosidase